MVRCANCGAETRVPIVGLDPNDPQKPFCRKCANKILEPQRKKMEAFNAIIALLHIKGIKDGVRRFIRSELDRRGLNNVSEDEVLSYYTRVMWRRV